MNENDGQFFSVRKEEDEHKAFIHHSARLPDTGFQEIVKRVFYHQRAIFAPSTEDPFRSAASPNQKQQIPTKEYISATFFLNKHFYSQDISIITGTMGLTILINEFLHHVLFSEPDNWRNDINFLVGDIGCGKSTFINYLITSRGAVWVKDKDTWFIRIDFDINAKFATIEYVDFLRGLYDQVIKVLEDNQSLLCASEAENRLYERLLHASPGKNRLHLESELSKFFRGYRQATGRQLFLIVDNLDYLYHLYDSGLFAPETTAGQVTIISVISDIVYRFYGASSSPLSLIGAKVLFVMRPDSYRTLADATYGDRLSNSPFESDDRLFTLKPPDWMEVVRGRCALLEHVVEKLNNQAKREAVSTIVERLMDDLASSASDSTAEDKVLEHLKKLTNFGLRAVMNHFTRYSWLEGGLSHSKTGGSERLIHQYPVSLMAFMLNERRRFSQEGSRFPNIFLVNATASGRGIPSRMSKPHRHTYWLKWLLLRIIVHRYRHQIPISSDDILRIFCDPEGHNTYERAIVELCLGTLCQVDCSNAITVERGASPPGTDLRLGNIDPTPRGLHVMEVVWDKFWYLQQIVDDPSLPIPKAVLGEFAYQRDVDYAYFVLPSHEYIVEARKMINIKARQVLIFLSVLRQALEFEKNRYYIVFDRLLGGEKLQLPDVSAIEKKICERISLLNNKLSCSIDVEGLRLSLKAIEPVIRDQFTEAYLK